MSRLQTSFVLGYHGCDRKTGMAVISGEARLKPSTSGMDWIGSGIYFWEGDPVRAREWAEQRAKMGKLKHPFVIGAVIDLGNCLDLLVRQDLELVRDAYLSFKKDRDAAGLTMPENKKAPKDQSPDLVMRYLDCAVIDYLHEITEKEDRPPGLKPFDSVRALFTEGELLYPNGGFKRKSHSQIAVRNTDCIKGYFLPLPPP